MKYKTKITLNQGCSNLELEIEILRTKEGLQLISRLVSKTYNYRFSWENQYWIFKKRDEESGFIKTTSMKQLKQLDYNISVTTMVIIFA